MKFKELGRTGEKLSCIGIGTWKLGYNPEVETEAIREALSLGVNFIDTAEIYHTEGLVGKAIKGEDVFIATKVSPDHFGHDDVIAACENSLKNLGVKTIDLYQLHWPNPGIPITETMAAMERLVWDGKIRHIGVSNFSIDEMKAAQAALKNEEIVSNQVEYSIFVREIGDYMIPYCRKNGITLIAYSPFGSGAMSRLTKTPLFRELEVIGSRHGKSPFQIALAWLISKDNVIPIPKASSSNHTRDNAESADIKLTKAEIKVLDSIKDTSISPLALRLTGTAKSKISLIAKIMEKRERLRKHGI